MRHAPGLILIVSMWAGGCARHVPAPPVVAPVRVEPPPPPPPKCETLDEKCAATAQTRVVVSPSQWSVAPPRGWTYAGESDAVVAVSHASALAIVVRDVGDPKKTTARDDALTAVMKRMDVEWAKKRKSKKTVWPRKPDKTIKVPSASVLLYQFEGAAREGKNGPLLVFTVSLPERRILVGAAFVPDDDATGADEAILTSIGSIAPSDDVAAKDAGAADADAGGT